MEEQKRWEKSMNRINPALQYVEKIEEISDIKKVAQMLSSGEWIAICATTSEPITFAMGKVTTNPTSFGERKQWEIQKGRKI